jgi:hypothetical protein
MIMMPHDSPWSSLQLTGQADFWHPTGDVMQVKYVLTALGARAQPGC